MFLRYFDLPEYEYSEKDIAIREQFVEEYLRDNDEIGALIRMGQPGQLVHSLAKDFMLDAYVRRRLQEKKEQLQLKIAERDPRFMGMVASLLFYEACNADKSSARITALGKLVDVLQIDQPQSKVSGGQQTLTLEELKQELTKRGFGGITLGDQFSRRT